jgi:hypothetical protein
MADDAVSKLAGHRKMLKFVGSRLNFEQAALVVRKMQLQGEMDEKSQWLFW